MDVVVSASPVDELEKLISPYYSLHGIYWRRMVAATGGDGWRRVAGQQYYVMKAAAPLLEFTAAQARHRGSAYDDLAAWCLEHADEERQHHSWFLDDLVLMGCDRDLVSQAVPDDEILDVLGAQFALVATSDPAAVLGFFFALEAHPSSPAAIMELTDRLGIPREALGTILFHAEEDLEHSASIKELVERYGWSSAFPSMCRSAVRSLSGWTRLFQRYAEQRLAAAGSSPPDAPGRRRPSATRQQVLG